MKTELELQKEFIEKPELKEQLEFLKKGGATGIQGVVLVEAFLKGIRDLGYKDTAYALNELNDNDRILNNGDVLAFLPPVTGG